MKYILKEVETSQYSFNPIHDYTTDRIFMTAGQQLQSDLGLSSFRHIFIQKVMGIGLPVYLITYNSKYPKIALSASRVKKLKFTWIGKAKRKGVHTYVAPMKLTPPLYLESSMISMTSSSLIIFRDLSGAYLENPRMFSVMYGHDIK